MPAVLLALTALSAIVLAAGFVWALAGGAKTVEQGEKVGARIMAEQVETEFEGETVAERTTFKGQAVSASRSAEISFRDIWKLIERGEWRIALPWLMALGGMMGLLLFGSLALLFGLESKLLGGLFVVVALYAVVRTALSFARA